MSRLFVPFALAPDLALLLGLAIRSLVVLLLAGLMLRIAGRRASAATRAGLLLTAMVALLLLPLGSRLLPTWRLPILPASVAPGLPAGQVPPHLSALQNLPSTPHTPAPNTALADQAPASISTASASYRVSVVFCLWAIGASCYGCWLLLGRVRLLTLAARCPVVSYGPLVEQVNILAADSGIRTPITVRQAQADPTGAITPMTWGWLRPTLLLPTDVLENWPAERVRAVLLHELAHIARRDWLTQNVLQLVCALYWFHPLVWRTASQWEREAEQACDDRVLEAGITASDYAAHLLEVVRSLRTLHPVVSQGSAHAMAAPRSNVQTRLIAILEERRNRRRTSRSAGLAALAFTGLFLLPIAALHITPRVQAAPLAQEDVGSLLDKAIERSWRGEWAAAAKLAHKALQQKQLEDESRGSAYWLLFEAAWWQGDSATENKYYTLFKTLAAKHADNDYLQSNLQIADRYRSGFNPKTASSPDLMNAIEYLLTTDAYADALHYAKYLLNRTDLTKEIRIRALLAAYRGAHYWSFDDSTATLEKQFQTEVATLPEEARKPFEKRLEAAKSEKTQEQAKEDGPVNLDFGKGLAGWANDNPQHDAGKLYTIGIDPKGRREGKSAAFLTSKGGDPKHYGTLMQNFVQPSLVGKRVRYSAYLKTEGVTQGSGLWIVLFGAKNHNHAWNMMETPIRGTNGWKKVEWVFDVPEDNTGFSFGIDLTGDGKVWVDDFQFEIVDKTVPVSPESN